MSLLNYVATAAALAGAAVFCQPAAADLLQRKDISAEIAVAIATTPMATCKANGYAVAATARSLCRFAVTIPARIRPRTASARPIPRAPSARRPAPLPNA